MAGEKRVLVLTADVGFGHRSAANAIVTALEERYGDRLKVEIANPLDDPRTSSVLSDSQTDYDRLVREMPEVYRLRYQLSDTPLPTSLLEGAVTVMLYKIVQDIVQQHKPDVVVSTHPLYGAPLRAALATGKRNIPFITIVTDLGAVHRIWFNSGTELCIVPTEAVRQLALENDIPDEHIQITGIPVNPALAREDRSKTERRQDLGWDTQKITALIVGSKRVKNLDEVVHVLNHSGLPVQLVAVAGGDDELYRHFTETEWHSLAHVYNFVDNMPDFMRAADLIICKAGGLIVTESLAAGLPLLLVDVTPGQEEGNADYVIKNGAGELAATPLNAMEILCHWLAKDCRLLYEKARQATALGRPRAAYAVADLIWTTAERDPQPVIESTQHLLPKLMELLGRFGLVGENAISTAGDKPQLVKGERP